MRARRASGGGVLLAAALARDAPADEPAGPPTAARQPAAGPAAPVPKVAPVGGAVLTVSRASLAIGGYAEVFYQWNFNRPYGGLTNYRGFDNRHASLTVSNAVLDAAGALGPVTARVALQIGHTPETYYLAEPVSPGSAGAGASGPQVWKYLQQALVGYRAPLGRGLLIEGGIYLSPIGPEGMAVKDQWHWSRSNLFFGLPFYHTGIRISYPVTEGLTVTLHGVNGWNSVVDNNEAWSLAAQLAYAIPERLSVGALYFTGIERPSGAPEGQPWRHLFDAYVQWQVRPWVALMLHGDGGFEPNAFGTSYWAAGAAYVRFQPHRLLALGARSDLFYEHVAEGAAGRAAPIGFPASLVASQTATAELRPADNLSLRLEYRHDHASEPLYFTSAPPLDAGGRPQPDATLQDTLTLGAVAWF